MSKIIEAFENLTNNEKGKAFELFTKAYLKKIDPVYKEYFEKVWLWNEYPDRKNRPDIGVDLVALDKYGNKWAIQVKYHEQYISYTNISTFLSMLNTKEFDYGMLITKSELSDRAKMMIANSQKKIEVITLARMLEEIDEETFSWLDPENVLPPKKKKIRRYQKQAIEEVIEGFDKYDRGKLIMPPGSGKTFVSLKIAERLVGKGGLVLFLCPSIALLDQTLRAWLSDSEIPIEALAVVSDKTVGKDKDTFYNDINLLSIPPTTDFTDLLNNLKHIPQDKMTVIFSTYQSLEVIEKTQKYGMPELDLAICDEAHRTAGIKLKSEDPTHFQKIHDNKYIKAKRRLYMTATPRIYEPNLKKKLEELEVDYYSMDDEQKFGKTFFEYTFRQAVDEGYLSDYKVIIYMMDEKEVQEKLFDYFKNRNSLNVENSVKLLGLWKVLQSDVINEFGEKLQEDFKRAIIFVGRIKESKDIAREFEKVISEYAEEELNENKKIIIKHIDGTMSSIDRKNLLDWLRQDPKGEIRSLANAKVLTEGIDVPALDAIAFLRPKDSVVEIIQALGRVMRKAPGKKYGYIVIPVIIRSDRPESEQMEETSYKTIWQIANALRAVDETFASRIRQLLIRTKNQSKTKLLREGDIQPTMPNDDSIIVDSTQQSPVLFEVRKALITKIAKSLGLTKKYLENWAKDVAKTAERLQEYIKIALTKEEKVRKTFEEFHEALKTFINEEIDENQVLSMVVQHILTKPIFEALFYEFDFVKNDIIAKSLEEITEIFKGYVERETKELKSFYESVKLKAQAIDKEEELQDFIRMLYDNFFKIAFRKTAEELGIVYTPVEVVDFIIKSVDYLLKEKFGKILSDENVVILEPFAGTGTFLARLLHHIPMQSLKRKYESNEIWGNEILLLSYYIAKTNLESTYFRITKEYKPFNNLLLVDTFRMMELIYEDKVYPSTISMFPQQYGELLNAEKNAEVNVIISNPPWFAWQTIENLGIKRPQYEIIRNRIKETYLKWSSAHLKTSLYDSYIMAIRMATDRIGDRGIIGFVTNNGWIDSSAMDGMRKILEEEFSEIYVLNLRGNARLKGEPRRKEGGGIFGQGSRAGVCIVLFVKDKKEKNEKAKIYYHDIGDYLSREKKLEKLREYGHVGNIEWIRIIPNELYDWINQRSMEYYKFPAIGSKKKGTRGIFEVYSSGIKSNRDAWVYNFSKKKLEENMRRMIDEYNRHVELVKKGIITKGNIDEMVNNDPSKITWDGTLKNELLKAKKHTYEEAGKIYIAMYRPFVKMFLYFSKVFNNSTYQLPKIFPEPNMKNLAICTQDKGANKPFSAIIVSIIGDLHILPTTQIFPLYVYQPSEMLFANKYQKQHNISKWILEEFDKRYSVSSPEDVFYYIYGILHSPDYRERYAAELKKDLPRIPFVKSKELFEIFREAGKNLADIHLNYETIEPYYGVKIKIDADEEDPQTYKITKMKLDKDNGELQYNDYITFSNILKEIFKYEINSRNPLEWVAEYYQIQEKKKEKIIWNPNDWLEETGNYKYIFDLIPRLITLSMKTLQIMERLKNKLDI